jgi:hypothetical protein
LVSLRRNWLTDFGITFFSTRSLGSYWCS